MKNPSKVVPTGIWTRDLLHQKREFEPLCHAPPSATPRFCVEGLPKIYGFGYSVPNWWQTDKKQELPGDDMDEAPVYLDRMLPIFWLNIGSDNIFNMDLWMIMEVNGAF